MADLAVPHVCVPGEAFRNKVRAAIVVWAKLWPHEVAQYKREVKARREQVADKEAHWKGDKSVIEYFRDPPRVKEMLGMSPWATKYMFGVAFGTGDNRWFFNPELENIFMDEVRDGFISCFRGGTSID